MPIPPQQVAKPEEKEIVKEIKKPTVVDKPQAAEPEPLVDYEPSAVMYETEESAASEAGQGHCPFTGSLIRRGNVLAGNGSFGLFR
jgi:hypothetical protein